MKRRMKRGESVHKLRGLEERQKRHKEISLSAGLVLEEESQSCTSQDDAAGRG